MPNPQVSPYPPSAGGQGPEAPQPDESKFRLGGLISSIVDGSSGRNIGLGQGLSYAVDPNKRAMYNQQQAGQIQQGNIELARQRDLMRHFQENPDSLNPDLIQHVALAHKAGFEAAQAGTEAGRAARIEGGEALAHGRYAREQGQTPEYTGLIQQQQKGAAEVSGAQAAARQGQVAAGSAERVSREAGYDPEYEKFKEQKALQEAQMAGSLNGKPTIEGRQIKLAEQEAPYKEFGEVAQPLGWAMMGDPTLAHRIVSGAAEGLPGGQTNAPAGPQYPNADHALEQEFARLKGGQPATPNAPTASSGGSTNVPKTNWRSLVAPGPVQGPPAPGFAPGTLGDVISKAPEAIHDAFKTHSTVYDLPGFRELEGRFGHENAIQLAEYLQTLQNPSKAKQMIQSLMQQGGR